MQSITSPISSVLRALALNRAETWGSSGIRRGHNRGITRGDIFFQGTRTLSLSSSPPSLAIFFSFSLVEERAFPVLCLLYTLESRNPTWAVFGRPLSTIARPVHPRPSLRSKKALDISFDPTKEPFPFFSLVIRFVRCLGRKDLPGLGRHRGGPVLLSPFLSVWPCLSPIPLFPASLVSSPSPSHAAPPPSALTRQSKGPNRGPHRRKREREKREQTGGAGRKAAGEGGAGGLERTRSPFTLLPGLGRYLSTVRRRAHARAFASFFHRRVPGSHKLACERVYVHTSGRERVGHVQGVRGERKEKEKEGKRETVASLVLRRPRALHSTQRRANPMGP